MQHREPDIKTGGFSIFAGNINQRQKHCCATLYIFTLLVVTCRSTHTHRIYGCVSTAAMVMRILPQCDDITGDQKVSVHLMITIQKVTSNVQSVPRQSPDIY
jgi:hypothetical protein